MRFYLAPINFYGYTYYAYSNQGWFLGGQGASEQSNSSELPFASLFYYLFII